MTPNELKEYIVESLPGIGRNLSKSLLEQFNSINKIFNADVEELKKVEKIGKKKAENIRKVIDEEYKL